MRITAAVRKNFFQEFWKFPLAVLARRSRPSQRRLYSASQVATIWSMMPSRAPSTS